MSHTPGPWRVSDDDHEDLSDQLYHFVSAGDGICSGGYEGFEIAGCMCIEDARLMAAAPELLEALRDALKAEEEAIESVSSWAAALGVHPELHARIEKMRAAIAKAMGETCAA